MRRLHQYLAFVVTLALAARELLAAQIEINADEQQTTDSDSAAEHAIGNEPEGGEHDNTGALLGDAGASLNDVVQFIAYVRDAADSSLVENFLALRLPHAPRMLVRAPVCRPNWLVEFECLAVTPNDEPRLEEF